jgi:iron(III) transport system substrate-binding protein
MTSIFRTSRAARHRLASRLALLLLAPWLIAAALSSCTRASPKAERSALRVFSPHSSEMVEYVVREFRQRTGIAVEVTSSSTGDLIERIAKQGGADVLWGGGVETLESRKELFAEYRSAEDKASDPRFVSAEGLWHPFSVMPVVIIYNRRLVPGDKVPGSWADLLDPYFKNRIIFVDPEKSGLSFTTLATMLAAMSSPGGGEESGWRFLERLARQLDSESIAANKRMPYDAVASGDFFVGFASEEAALSLLKSGAEIGYGFPEEGTSAVPDGAALVKSSDRREAGGRFIDFILGKDVQGLLSERWKRRSVRVDVGEAGTGGGARMRLLPYDVAGTAARRDLILSRWKAVADAGRP